MNNPYDKPPGGAPPGSNPPSGPPPGSSPPGAAPPGTAPPAGGPPAAYPPQGAAPVPYPMQGQQQPPPYGQMQPGANSQAPYGQMPPGASPQAPYGIDPKTGLPFSEKQKIVAGLLQIFLGAFGVGRFYTGHIGLGVAQLVVCLLTCYIASIWPLIDGILMLTGQVTDSNGLPLRD